MYQSFIPESTAAEAFKAQLRLAQKAGYPPYLAVFKRHRRDDFLMTHSVDGYSLALDFRITKKNRAAIWKLAAKLDEIVRDRSANIEKLEREIGRLTEHRNQLGSDMQASREHEVRDAERGHSVRMMNDWEDNPIVFARDVGSILRAFTKWKRNRMKAINRHCEKVINRQCEKKQERAEVGWMSPEFIRATFSASRSATAVLP